MKMHKMKFLKKSAIGAAVVFLGIFAEAQTVEEGMVNVDANKFAKARQIYQEMITKSGSDGSNYFYMGNTYLTQFEPDFDKASEYFKKGLAADGKNLLNKIGLASVKLGRGDRSGITDIQNLASDSKDPDVLFHAAEALTMYENTSSPDLAITMLNKAIDRSKKSGVPAPYYYTLGDAYRIKKMPGEAMTAYENALSVARNKASVYTRMGTLWMAAQQWQQAKQNIDKAISVDATYAPAYKALAMYDWRFQKPTEMTQDLINYTKYADEDPSTQMEIAKLYYTNDDFANAKSTLNKVFDKVDDPIKYKLRAYISYESERNYAAANEDIDKFFSSVKDKSRIQAADQGLKGLILAGLAKTESNQAKKSAYLNESAQKVALAKAAKDETLDWDKELAYIQGGGAAVSTSAVASGPTNPKIEALKKKAEANPNDTNALVELGTAYQEAQNWAGALQTWQKMATLVPDWEYSYYGQGVAYQQLANEAMAQASYQKYIDTLLKKPAADQENNKVTLSYAYYLVAFYSQKSDLAKAKDYAAKAVQLNPGYQDAVNLSSQLNK